MSHMAAVEDDEPNSNSAGEDFVSSRPAKKRRHDTALNEAADPEGPACQSCRRKKAKCTRRQPCSACVRYNVECLYDDRKNKPGLRTGAVENLSQRVATLESMFLGQGVLWQQVFNQLSSLTGQGDSSPGRLSKDSGLSLQECASHLKSTLSNLAESGPVAGSAELYSSQWPGFLQNTDTRPTRTSGDACKRCSALPYQDSASLPPPDLVDSLVDIYFANLHPWIPMLHVREFRERMADAAERPRLRNVFQAIVSTCARFADDARLGSPEAKAQMTKRYRQAVIVESMESFSVENLQALIICAFDTSIVGSMTRTVEQLQLSVEEDQTPPARALIKRIAFLKPCKTWVEREERRRVFWNTFLLDRFCSIATGWNFSLTSADVKRRLPCEGALWEAGHPLQTPTPYFGVADPSSGTNGPLPAARPEGEAQDSIGGFAYCIEATESLSLVTSFFLQQAVDVTKPQEVQMWLLKFKQLDLRLVQWKIFLPEQWREACALNCDGILDPNLTLAHISHNTAVVLLHQGIAYPAPDWQTSGLRLPSASSSETCLAAATEVAIIAEKFLQGSTALTNPQFAFCLFICGRMFLAHAIYYSVPLPQGFDSLVYSLQEMSKRWNGPGDQVDNLASKFARRLVRAREQGHGMLDLSHSVYFDETKPEGDPAPDVRTAMPNMPHSMVIGQPNQENQDGFGPYQAMNDYDQDASPDSISLAFPPLPVSFYNQQGSRGPTAAASPVAGNALPPSRRFENGAPVNGVGPSSMEEFGDLSTYLDYSFLPAQRISVFSGLTEKNPQE
ncbi:hypothetical protein BN1723_014013 [Verticillium longisporum]|uniref:Zn(2)-C6 fungal-type domain-containing protein n=1 Tax=Verticillium longisporum TaxID=100787 RepID=A0A0G4M0F2_VERLO|nr:hypothetical protein BN1708_010962 [Verticillium longisporum]CRK27759.1 hypothetical protein BN1723_014013 [Verticillium longisporum]